MGQRSCVLFFACSNCSAVALTSRCHTRGKSTPLLEATGVFRAVTECHCGPTKGRESPTLDGGPTRGGMDLQVNPVLLANPFHRPWRQELLTRTGTQCSQFVPVLAQPPLERPHAHPGSIGQLVFIS